MLNVDASRRRNDHTAGDRHRVSTRVSTARRFGDFFRRPPPEAQDEVQRVSFFQLKIAELLIRAAELLPAEDNALLFRGDSLLSLVFVAVEWRGGGGKGQSGNRAR